jgi:alkylation response protein AidB-like acyl-CoA dehydrogenase
MDFDLTDEQREIKQTARALLAERSSFEHVRTAAEGGGYDESLWRELRTLGWTGIGIPEEHGGIGLGTVELAVLVEELGYAVTPSRFLANALAALVVAAGGSEEQRARRLPGFASGDSPGTVAYAHAGTADLVPDAAGAAAIVLVEDGQATIVDAADATVEPRATIDPTRTYARVSATDGDVLPEAVEAGLDRAEILLAAELVGIAQRALELTVEYAKTRTQFGHPIGVFQAVSHRCAEMLLETEGARSAVYGAAWAADAAPERLAFAASVAKAASVEAAKRVTATAIQLHGGVGFTWEADLHWLFKRARLDAVQLGSAREHRARVARIAAGAGQEVGAPR